MKGLNAQDNARAALAEIAGMPTFKASGNSDNAGNLANLRACKIIAQRALESLDEDNR